MPEFYTLIARKIFFPNVRGGIVPLLPPSPTAMASLTAAEAMRFIFFGAFEVPQQQR